MRKKKYLTWWKDKNMILYYGDQKKLGRPDFHCYFNDLGFPHMPTHPLVGIFRGYIYNSDEPNVVLENRDAGYREIQHLLPLPHTLGGVSDLSWASLKDLETLKIYINFPIIRKIFINNARVIYNYNIYENKYFEERHINWIRKAMQTYAKVAEDPIYQEVLDKYHWNEGQECDVQKFTYYLQRFINAQDFGGRDEGMSDYKTALQEIKNGRKETHWIWYIFPQMKGLGHSPTSDFYGIEDREEAYAYMEHPILSSRLIEATEAVLNNKHSAYEIFGHDVIKFRSCMLLFSTVSDNPVFKQVLRKHSW